MDQFALYVGLAARRYAGYFDLILPFYYWSNPKENFETTVKPI